MSSVKNRKLDRVTLVLLILSLVVICFLVSMLLFFSPMQVSGESMEPNYYDKERIFVCKTARNFSFGDVVIFHKPGAAKGEIPLIKRVIGVPGDTIQLTADSVLRNGVPLDESGYGVGQGVTKPKANESGKIITSWTVPESSLFVLGDNRSVSIDSRIFGAVPLDNIIGLVL